MTCYSKNNITAMNIACFFMNIPPRLFFKLSRR